jgi:hypothetical protein
VVAPDVSGRSVGRVAVINLSGNVGKTTIARHLLVPRIEGAQFIAFESINADEGHGQSLRGRQFAELQEHLQTLDSVVADIGASNVEDLLDLMRKYQGSHENFDYFVIPTVATLKQQQDTIAILAELARLGVPASQLRVHRGRHGVRHAAGQVGERSNTSSGAWAKRPAYRSKRWPEP